MLTVPLKNVHNFIPTPFPRLLGGSLQRCGGKFKVRVSGSKSDACLSDDNRDNNKNTTTFFTCTVQPQRRGALPKKKHFAPPRGRQKEKEKNGDIINAPGDALVNDAPSGALVYCARAIGGRLSHRREKNNRLTNTSENVEKRGMGAIPDLGCKSPTGSIILVHEGERGAYLYNI